MRVVAATSAVLLAGLAAVPVGAQLPPAREGSQLPMPGAPSEPLPDVPGDRARPVDVPPQQRIPEEIEPPMRPGQSDAPGHDLRRQPSDLRPPSVPDSDMPSGGDAAAPGRAPSISRPDPAIR